MTARSTPPRTGFWYLVRSDLTAKAAWCYESSTVRDVVKVCFSDGTAAMIVYRLMQWSRRWRLSPLEMVFNKLNAVCCNCIIGRGADFGPGFVLVHSTGVVINGSVRGGEHVYIEHQVTIGAEKRRAPVIGNYVFVGAGAKVIGSITIGDNVRIGANAVVCKSLPSNVTAVGVPARILDRSESDCANELPADKYESAESNPVDDCSSTSSQA